MKKSNLDKAFASLKKRLLADAEYALDNHLKSDDIIDALDFQDIEKILKPLYAAALTEVALGVRS